MKRTQDILLKDCIEFFETIEEDGCFIKYADQRKFKASNKKMCYFWRPHKDYIYKLIQQDEYKKKYPLSFRLINRYYKNHYEVLSHDKKISELINILENNKYQKVKYFSDGTFIHSFIRDHLKEIYDNICNDKNRKKYSKAYEFIFRKYNSKIVDKCYELFNTIENERRMIKSKDNRKLKNGPRYCYFWNFHKDIIIIISTFSEFVNKYPLAVKIIQEAYNRSQATHKNKCLEYIKIINKKGCLLQCSDTIKLNCGVIAYNFAKYNYKKIYQLFDKEENKQKYPKAYELLKEKVNNITPRISLEEKIQEFYQLVESKNRMIKQKENDKFSDNTYVKSLIMNFRVEIYQNIVLEKNKEAYPNAYAILVEDYKRHILYKNRKDGVNNV